MSDTLKRLTGPAYVPTTAGIVYTVPLLTTAVLRHLHVTNETGTAATFTLTIGTNAGGNRLFYQVPVQPGSMGLDWTGNVVLAAGETLRAQAGTLSALVLTASGIESV